MKWRERGSCAALIGAVAWVSLVACSEGGAREQSSPVTGTETNWMKVCDQDDQCGELSCVCGVCTRTCTAGSDCPFANAQCRQPTSDDLRCEPESVGEVCLPDANTEDSAVPNTSTLPPVDASSLEPGNDPVTPDGSSADAGSSAGPTLGSQQDAASPSGAPVDGAPPETAASDASDAETSWACDPGRVPTELDRSCETNEDCAAVTFVGTCGCTHTFLGFAARDAAALEAHLASCVDPSVGMCECPAALLLADNGDLLGSEENGRVECQSGSCTTRRDPEVCLGTDECLLQSGECVSTAPDLCRDEAGVCDPNCAQVPAVDLAGTYLLWQAPGGAAGTGPGLELIGTGVLRGWQGLQAFEVRQTTGWDFELQLTPAEHETLIGLLLAVDFSNLPHPGVGFECYPALYFEAPGREPLRLDDYASAEALSPELDAVYAWFDALLMGEPASSTPPSRYCVLP